MKTEGKRVKPKKLKVWGISSFYPGVVGTNGRNQVRLVVAAETQKKAAEALRETLHFFRAYGAETGNKMECEAALSQPYKVFWRTLDVWNEPLKPVPELKEETQ